MLATLKRIILSILVPLLAVVWINQFSGNNVPALRSFLAFSPILVVLVLMTAFRLGGQYAGPIGLLAGITVAFFSFGLTSDILLVSQTKGLYLTLFVMAVILPALFLYHVVNQAGGIQSIAQALESLITDRGTLLIVVAWAFSSTLEGLAGFGLPVAIVSPIMVGLGVPPVLAVASVAIGHAWSVTFGDMGVVYQTLISVVKVNPAELAGNAAFMLGIACLACGLAVAHLFQRLDRWLVVLVLAGIMGTTQYIFAVFGLYTLAGFFAGLSGVTGGVLINRLYARGKPLFAPGLKMSQPLLSAILSYGSLALIMTVIAVVEPIHRAFGEFVWRVSFPEIRTLNGFVTAAVKNQSYRPLLHPGASIAVVGLLSYLSYQKIDLYPDTDFRKIASITIKSAFPAFVGILSMVGLSALMDHAGMNFLLAELLSRVFQSVFPLISPFIGMLGAFATGSNNNSNVLFGSLQEEIAIILNLAPGIIVSSQTAGGSLGSMIAPAKIFVGCSTVNLQGRDGEVLRRTIPYGLVIGLVMGFVTYILIQLP